VSLGVSRDIETFKKFSKLQPSFNHQSFINHSSITQIIKINQLNPLKFSQALIIAQHDSILISAAQLISHARASYLEA